MTITEKHEFLFPPARSMVPQWLYQHVWGKSALRDKLADGCHAPTRLASVQPVVIPCLRNAMTTTSICLALAVPSTVCQVLCIYDLIYVSDCSLINAVVTLLQM